MEIELKNIDVILKKTKITKSIIAQSQDILPHLIVLKPEIVPVGICFYGGKNIFVYYNNDKNVIVTSPIYNKNIKVLNDSEANVFLEDGQKVLSYWIGTTEQRVTIDGVELGNSITEMMTSMRETLIEKGKFYL